MPELTKMSSWERRIKRIQSELHGSGAACPECGYRPDEPVGAHGFEVFFGHMFDETAPEPPDDLPSFCATCGKQSGFIVRWTDEVNEAEGTGRNAR